MPAFIKDLEQAAPTIGSTLGAIGGGLLGGAVDVGTLGLAAPLVNPVTLGAAGAGLGGAAGQGIENATQPKQYQQSPLKTGVESAALDVAGGAVGKGLGLLGKGAKSLVAPSIVQQSADQLDHPTAQYLADNGVNTFDEAKNLANTLTGDPTGEGALFSKAVKNAADNSTNTVDLNPEFGRWQEPLQGYPGERGSLKDISNTVNDVLNNAVATSGGTVTKVAGKGATSVTVPNTEALGKIKPGAAFVASKTLRNAADVASNGARDATGAVINSGKAAAADTYNALAKNIEDKIFGLDETGKSAIPLTDADKQSMKDDLLNTIGKSNPQLYGKLSGDIDNATTYADIRSAQAPFVKVSQAANAAEKTAANAPGKAILPAAGATIGLMGGGPIGAAGGAGAGYLASKALALPAVEKAGSTTASKAANVLARISKLAPATTTAIGTAAANPALNSPQASALPTTTPQGGIPMAPTATPAVAGGASAAQPANIFQSLIPGGGAPAIDRPLALQAMAAMFDPNLMSQFTPAASAATNTIQQAQEAEAALQALRGTYGQAQGGQGTGGGGILDRLHQMISGQSASPLAGGYNSQSQQLDQLLKSLGAPTQAPSLFLQGPAANNQFSAIQQFLSTLGANPGAQATPALAQ